MIEMPSNCTSSTTEIETEIQHFVDSFKKINRSTSWHAWAERPATLNFVDDFSVGFPTTSSGDTGTYGTTSGESPLSASRIEGLDGSENSPSPTGTGSSIFDTCSEGSPSLLTEYVMAQSDPCGDLTVLDVADLLHARYSFISGGKDRYGHTLITFPDNPTAPELSEEQYRKVVNYLTCVPSSIDERLEGYNVGFSLIVDRRQDRWSSVKAILCKISGYFPADLHVVFILRPKGFFQRAISDMGFKFVKDEYKFQVVMCHSIEELHQHIDRNQLTKDLGGNIKHDEKEWIQHRLAIEKFSANTKNISQTLTAFIQRLRETELPNDVQGTLDLIHEHNLEKKEVFEDMNSATEHGEALLNCIKNPCIPVDDDEYEVNSDMLVHVVVVQRLLTQLQETVNNCLHFWAKHDMKLHQCHQLRKFEEAFKQLQYILNNQIEELKRLTDPGDSLQRVETYLRKLEEIHKESKEPLEKAEELQQEGEKFIADEHYAVDCIMPKCSELERMYKEHRSLYEARKEMLETSLELQQRIDKASKWCTKGVDLLATQQIEKCQTQDGAGAAVSDIEAFLITARELNLSNPKEFRKKFDIILTPESRNTVQNVLKRIDDVQNMCEKRRDSLKKVATKLKERPIQAVIPEPATPILTNPPTHNINPPPNMRPPQRSITDYEIRRKTPKHEVAARKSRSIDQRSSRIRVQILRDYDGTATKDGNESSTSLDSDMELNPDTVSDKRGHVMKELIDTERIYVSELSSIIEGYILEMDNPDLQDMIPAELIQNKDILFGNLEEIYEFHNGFFLKELENCRNTPALVGKCFVDRKEEFEIYSLYCQNKPQAESIRKLIGDNNLFFKECQKKLGHKLPLSAYLLKPVQRITKYQLLLKEMLKYTKNQVGNMELQEAVDTMLTVLKYVNDLMHALAISGFTGNQEDLGRFLMQGQFYVWQKHEKDKIRDFRFKPQNRNVFLYQRALMFCKKLEDPNNIEKVQYVFKNLVKTAQIGMTENVKTDKKKFEVWLHGRSEVYILQAPNMDEKARWVKEIKKVLLFQFESLKEQQERIRKGSIMALNTEIDVKTNLQKSANAVNNNNMGSTTRVNELDGFSDDGWSSDEFDSSEQDNEGHLFPSPSDNTGSLQQYMVLADYDKVDDQEVGLKEGDVVEVIKCGNDGWWYVHVVRTAEEGWAPASYLDCMSRVASRSTLSVSSLESGNGNGNGNGGLFPTSSRNSITSTVSMTILEDTV
ncbi:guanine nucleotide exchange factor DBS-like isoform X2 [Lineus longissimus]|uniref:guanine nucleotide exchange factor DBS-like isoform X2 n=1 Tax=Lineus longissimus TaxID=88925 RepID=UPI00315C7A71